MASTPESISLEQKSQSENDGALVLEQKSRSDEVHALAPAGLSRREFAKEFSSKAIPLIVVGGIQSLRDFGRLSILSRGENGEKYLAVDALLNLTLGLVLTIDTGFLYPASLMISNAHGRGDHERVGHIVQQNWIISTFFNIPTFPVLFFAEPILNLFGQDRELTAMVGPYGKIVAFASPAIYWLYIDTSLLTSTSRMKPLIIVKLASLAINLGLTALLVPKYGMIGAGIAVFADYWSTCIGLKLYFLTDKFRIYRLFNFRSSNFDLIKEIRKELLKSGFILSFTGWCEQGKGFVIGLFMGWLGPDRLAINAASEALLQLMVPLSLGVRQGAQICVGQFKGKKNYVEMKKFGNLGILLELGVNIVPFALYATIPKQLLTMFIPEENVEQTDTMIRIIFITKALQRFLDIIQTPTIQNLYATMDIKFPAIVQIITTIVATMPLSYLLAFTLGWDLVGLNSAFCLSSAIEIPFLLYRWCNIEKYIREPVEEGAEPLALPEPSHPALEPLEASKASLDSEDNAEETKLMLDVPDQINYGTTTANGDDISTATQSSQAELRFGSLVSSLSAAEVALNIPQSAILQNADELHIPRRGAGTPRDPSFLPLWHAPSQAGDSGKVVVKPELEEGEPKELVRVTNSIEQPPRIEFPG